MEEIQIEIDNYTVDNTDFVKFAFQNSTSIQQQVAKDKYYVYNHLRKTDKIDYNELFELTGINKNRLASIVFFLRLKYKL